MAAPTTLSSLLSSSAGNVAANATAALSSTLNTVVQTPSEPIFLQTKLAQGIAGTFVFAALFLTCQQVGNCSHTNINYYMYIFFILDISSLAMVYKSN